VALVPGDNLGIVVLSSGDWHFLPTVLAQRILDSYLGNQPRDWCSELIRATRTAEKETKAAKERVESERIQNTAPSLALSQYVGDFADELYGRFMVQMENDKLVLRHGPSAIGDLEHWNYDTFRATWREPWWVLKSFISFYIDRQGRVDEIKVSGLDLDDIVARRVPTVPIERPSR
jgi:hypothetical protein